MTTAANGEWDFPNRATPLGSAAYYAVRFSPAELHRRYATLLGWLELIEETALNPRDPGIARLKLDWWRGELAALAADAARHPLAIALAEEGLGQDAVRQLDSVLDEAESLTLRSQTADDEGFIAHCRHWQGPVQALLAEAEGLAPAAVAASRAAGAYCTAVWRIRDLARVPHCFPAELQPEQLQRLTARQRAARLEALLGRLAPDNTALSQGTALARRLAALSAALHDKMRRRDYPVLDTRIERPPIAHLWTAWRCR